METMSGRPYMQEDISFLHDPIIQEGVTTVFLLGKTLRTETTETVFAARQEYSRVSHYFLLLLTQGCDERKRHQLQDKIEQHAHPPLTILLLDCLQFGNWLEEGHFFATTVRCKAAIIYDAGLYPLAEVPAPKEEKPNRNHQLYRSSRTSIEEFLAGAELYMVRGQWRLSAFMLHQAAEQALRALLILHTGMHVVTHSLDRLTRYCLMFCCELSALWEKGKGEGKQLLSILQKAYIDARYRTDYAISSSDVKALTVRVRALQKIFEERCAQMQY